MVLISAHRGGAGDDHAAQNTSAAFEAAIAAGCDYVEIDVRLTADGHAVVSHDDAVRRGDVVISIAGSRYEDLVPGGVTALDDVLHQLAGRAGAHVDLKGRGGEVEIARQVLAVLAVDDVVITTTEDASVRLLVAWAHRHAPGLRIGLSSGTRSSDGRWRNRVRVHLEAAFPRTRLRRSGADVVVAHRTLARLWLRSWARRQGLPLLVWTVDRPAELDRWMNDPHTWMVTTNHPARAAAAVR